MCRAIIYLGEKTALSPFVFDAQYSLVSQSTNPRFMSHSLNLSGNGFLAWRQEHEEPLLYKSKNPSFYDCNLKNLASSVESENFIAHIRGGPLDTRTILSDQNAHPFYYPDAPIAFAHNGGLRHNTEEKNQLFYAEIKKHISSHRFSQLMGTTDTEVMYALLLSFLDQKNNRESLEAVKESTLEMLSLIYDVRSHYDITLASPVNLFISAPDFILALRYTYNFGIYENMLTREIQTYYSLWYSYGEAFAKTNNGYQMTPGELRSICFASEPLSHDNSTWLEVPEYSLFTVKKGTPLVVTVEDVSL